MTVFHAIGGTPITSRRQELSTIGANLLAADAGTAYDVLPSIIAATKVGRIPMA